MSEAVKDKQMGQPGHPWEAARMPNGDVYLRRVGGGAARLVTAAEVAAIVAAEKQKALDGAGA
jgi:hypothetical protein